jgi:hypothetical protein
MTYNDTFSLCDVDDEKIRGLSLNMTVDTNEIIDFMMPTIDLSEPKGIKKVETIIINTDNGHNRKQNRNNLF